MVRCPTSPEAVAFAMNVRVVAPRCDLSYDCFRYFTLDLLTNGEGVPSARGDVRVLRHRCRIPALTSQ